MSAEAAPAVNDEIEAAPAEETAAAEAAAPAEEPLPTDTFEPLAPNDSAPAESVPTEPTPAESKPTEEPAAVAAVEPAAGDAVGSTKSLDGGKWGKVDTSYVDWRTADPDRLEVRKSATEGVDAGSLPVGAMKSTDGKWQVDMSHINHRTGNVENREGRRGSEKVGAVDDGKKEGSATVKKNDDGKWKVDTSYIGYRTGDTANLQRKEDDKNEKKYADPNEKKYAYDALKGNSRPDDVDPAKKEQYLSNDEFQTVMGIARAEFDKMPKWKASNLKKAKDVY